MQGNQIINEKNENISETHSSSAQSADIPSSSDRAKELALIQEAIKTEDFPVLEQLLANKKFDYKTVLCAEPNCTKEDCPRVIDLVMLKDCDRVLSFLAAKMPLPLNEHCNCHLFNKEILEKEALEKIKKVIEKLAGPICEPHKGMVFGPSIFFVMVFFLKRNSTFLCTQIDRSFGEYHIDLTECLERFPGDNVMKEVYSLGEVLARHEYKKVLAKIQKNNNAFFARKNPAKTKLISIGQVLRAQKKEEELKNKTDTEMHEEKNLNCENQTIPKDDIKIEKTPSAVPEYDSNKITNFPEEHQEKEKIIRERSEKKDLYSLVQENRDKKSKEKITKAEKRHAKREARQRTKDERQLNVTTLSDAQSQSKDHKEENLKMQSHDLQDKDEAAAVNAIQVLNISNANILQNWAVNINKKRTYVKELDPITENYKALQSLSVLINEDDARMMEYKDVIQYHLLRMFNGLYEVYLQQNLPTSKFSQALLNMRNLLADKFLEFYQVNGDEEENHANIMDAYISNKNVNSIFRLSIRSYEKMEAMIQLQSNAEINFDANILYQEIFNSKTKINIQDSKLLMTTVMSCQEMFAEICDILNQDLITMNGAQISPALYDRPEDRDCFKTHLLAIGAYAREIRDRDGWFCQTYFGNKLDFNKYSPLIMRKLQAQFPHVQKRLIQTGIKNRMLPYLINLELNQISTFMAQFTIADLLMLLIEIRNTLSHDPSIEQNSFIQIANTDFLYSILTGIVAHHAKLMGILEQIQNISAQEEILPYQPFVYNNPYSQYQAPNQTTYYDYNNADSNAYFYGTDGNLYCADPTSGYTYLVENQANNYAYGSMSGSMTMNQAAWYQGNYYHQPTNPTMFNHQNNINNNNARFDKSNINFQPKKF